MLFWHQFAGVSVEGGSAGAAFPSLHGAGGPFGELISLGIVIGLMAIVAAVFIWAGRKKGKQLYRGAGLSMKGSGYLLQRGPPRLLRGGLALFIGLMMALTGARPVLAHAELLGSDPPANAVLPLAPDRVTLSFSEPVEPGFTRAQVLDAQRQRVDADDTRFSADRRSLSVGLKKPLPEGTYLVAWRAVSAVDGHDTVGAFPFSIGKAAAGTGPSAQESPVPGYTVRSLEVIGRLLHLLGTIVMTGGGIFALVVALPVFGASRLHDSGKRRKEEQAVESQALSILVLLLRVSFGVLAFGAIVILADQSLKLEVSPLRIANETRFGFFWVLRLGLMLGLAAALIDRWPSASEDRRLKALLAGTTALGALLLLTTSLTSHSAALPGPTALYVLADWVHTLAASAWMGGLFHLAVTLVIALGHPRRAERVDILAKVVPRFSGLAVASVGVLILTGVVNTLVQVGDVSALVTTAYGNVLLVKLGLLTPTFALGAANALWSRPRIVAAARARIASVAARVQQRFSLLVRSEALLGLLVIGVTALLVTLPPAAGQVAARPATAGRQVQLTQRADDLQIALTISPGRPGLNAFEVALSDAQGRRLTTSAAVTLNFRNEDTDVGVSTLDLQPAGNGMYRAVAGNLGVRGRWSIEMFVRRPNAFDARSVFSVSVEEVVPASRFAPSAAPAPPLVEARAGGVAF